MAEHLLDDLDVGAARDGEASGRVSQLVRVQVGHADRPRRRAECAAKRADPRQLAVADACEHQVVGLLALHVGGEFGSQEARDRHLPPLMGLGGAPHEPLTLHGVALARVSRLLSRWGAEFGRLLADLPVRKIDDDLVDVRESAGLPVAIQVITQWSAD